MLYILSLQQIFLKGVVTKHKNELILNKDINVIYYI